MSASLTHYLEPVGRRLGFHGVLATEPVAPFAFLGKVRCPVRVVAGAESPVMPPEAARLFAAAIPGATLELLDGIGHHVELEAPEVVAERIRLLAARA